MRRLRFSDDNPVGFLLDEVHNDVVSGRFIEKVSYVETIEDPFGQKFEIDRIAFKQTHFHIQESFPQIELSEPPRGIQTFISKLMEVSGFSLTIGSMSVDVSRWVERVEDELSRRVIVNMMQIKQEMSADVQGTLCLAGPSYADVRRFAKEYLEDRRHQVERVRISLDVGNGRSAWVELRASGAARSDIDDENLRRALRSALAAQRNGAKSLR
jgi:hypothetical protein